MHILRYNFKYSTESIELMLPWEKTVELEMILNSLNKENKIRNQFSE